MECFSSPESLRHLLWVFCTVNVSVRVQVCLHLPSQSLFIQFFLQDDDHEVFPPIHSLMISQHKLLHSPFGFQEIAEKGITTGKA